MEMQIPELQNMSTRMDALESLLTSNLIAMKSKSVVTVTDVAQIEGVSLSQVRKGGKERYLLPRFGESAYPTGTIRWSLEEYLEWRKKDPFEREKAYREKLRKEALAIKRNR